jgi:hypothetical protein
MPDTVLSGQADAAEVGENLMLARLARIGQRLEVNPDQVLQALEDLAEAVPPRAHEGAAQLSEHDQATLREVGLLRRPTDQGSSRSPVRAAVRYAQLLADALSVKDTAARLSVSEGRVRQRLGDSSLYGVHTKQGWRLPPFQFGPNGKPLPGLERVLRALPHKLHPLSIEGFFTRPNTDLETDGTEMCAADWLAAGGDPEVVAELAHDLLLSA